MTSFDETERKASGNSSRTIAATPRSWSAFTKEKSRETETDLDLRLLELLYLRAHLVVVERGSRTSPFLSIRSLTVSR